MGTTPAEKIGEAPSFYWKRQHKSIENREASLGLASQGFGGDVQPTAVTAGAITGSYSELQAKGELQSS